MNKLKSVLTNWKIAFCLVFILVMILYIQPTPWADGVTILSVGKDSPAAKAGFQSPSAGTKPLAKERILRINNQAIHTEQDYHTILQTLTINQTVQFKTTKGLRAIRMEEKLYEIELNETELINVPTTITENITVNGTTTLQNLSINKTVEVRKRINESLGLADIGLRVGPAPTTNLRKGLDLQGGTRVIITPAEEVSTDVLTSMVDSISQRLNVYGLSDIRVSLASSGGPLGGDQSLILVEIASATEQEVRDLLSKQGKFEARIANQTVFKGGSDITYVDKQQAGIEGCTPSQSGWSCGFQFGITLSPEAAQRQADITRTIPIEGVGINAYLRDKLDLYLDDEKVDSLSIAADLKGRAITQISISGPGSGRTEADAKQDAKRGMRNLQTILITGSLPARIEILKLETISPVLGSQFIKNALFTAIIAVLCVSIILLIAYRKIILALPIIGTIAAETIGILGMAAIIGQNMDLAAIAGILASVGTGVDDQIVILDETLRRHKESTFLRWNELLSQAMFIITSGFATKLVAMTPLLFASAGLLKGFAITTILGLLIGILITRPAYAALVQILFED